MIISIAAEKVFDKMQDIFMIKKKKTSQQIKFRANIVQHNKNHIS